jgi:DNA-binding NarL/FixJ family response regulator
MAARHPRPSSKNDETSAPAELRVSMLRVGAHELAVLSFPIKHKTLPDDLTGSERAIGVALARGRSNREIAETRGTSVRTVANQVASLLRKLGVSSRAEAGALFFGAFDLK